jgi:RNA polymerase sigma factor for flagellar operon FliA
MAARDPSLTAPYGAPELEGLALPAARHETAAELEAQRAQAARTAEDLLWRRFVEHRDPQARETLIMLHLPYAKAVAAGLYGKHVHHETEFKEYLQLATLGLIEALDRYDPSRGAQFRTYAHWRMLGAIRDGLAHISERQEQLGLHRRLAAERLAAAKGSERLREDGSDGEQLLRDMAEISAGLLLSFMLDDTGMLDGAQSTLPDGCYDALFFKQQQQHLRRLIDRLTPREQSVIRLHYLQGLTYENIARTLGITKGRVAQLHEQGLNRLRGLVSSEGRN